MPHTGGDGRRLINHDALRTKPTDIVWVVSGQEPYADRPAPPVSQVNTVASRPHRREKAIAGPHADIDEGAGGVGRKCLQSATTRMEAQNVQVFQKTDLLPFCYHLKT
jgi:hypothetical protein